MEWSLIEIALDSCSEASISMEISEPFAIFTIYESIFDVLINKKEALKMRDYLEAAIGLKTETV